MSADIDDPRVAFVDASFWHGSKARADAILATHPKIAGSDIHMAATLGDADAVRRFIAQDPAHATATGGPRNVDALTYLCFSTYLRDDRDRSVDFVRAATAVLDAGPTSTPGSSTQPIALNPNGKARSTVPPAWPITPSSRDC